MNSLASLLPDFAIIAVGVLIGKRLATTTWQQIDGLCYYLLYPALLFSAASQRNISIDSLLTIGVLAVCVVTVGFLLAVSVRSLFVEEDLQNRAGISQNAWRFNTALGFVAVTALPAETFGVLAIVVGLAIPVANLYAVLALTSRQEKSKLTLLREIALNPFLLASLAGVLVGLSGKPIPETLAAFVDRFADAAIPIILLSLGAALRCSRSWSLDRYSVAISCIKLIILPTFVWLILSASGIHGVVAATLLVFAALPTTSVAHVLAARYGADRNRVAIVVMQSTIIGLFTLPVWTMLAVRIASH